MTARSIRDPFGRPLGPPALLSREERVELLREIADALDAGRMPSRYAGKYLAGALREWLRGDGDLERLLGVRPSKGSHKRPATVLRQQERDAMVLRFAARFVSDRAAVLVLRGERSCPDELVPLRDEIAVRGAPKSSSGITKARRRVSRHRDERASCTVKP
ncbi:MAG: hypothetical protein KJ011_05270 [Burkholderiaceae bacterium]|nr:hypothetical protein [Burkholderiaceae bacterium]